MSLNSNQKDNNLAISKTLVQSNPVYMFACTKAERLVTAIHLVTRHIGEKEPLRTSLRKESISLLQLLHVHDERVSEDALSERILYIESLLDASYHSGFISQINYAVVHKEYDALDKFLKSKQGVFGSTETVVGDVFFDIPEPEAEEIFQKVPKVSIPQAGTIIIKDKTLSKGQASIAAVKPKKRNKQAVRRKTGRKSIILDLLKRQKKVSVKDVAVVVTGVSEKTIQRELLALVEEGIVVKEGERRWSTYSLVR